MKTLLIFALLGLSSVSFAAAECPVDTKLAITCKPNPQDGDGQFAVDMLDSVAVCKRAADTVFVFEKEGASASDVVTVESRIGSDFISVADDITIYSFSWATGAPGPDVKAKLSITFKEVADEHGRPTVSSATYACKLNL